MLREDDMCRIRSRNVLRKLITELRYVNSLKQSFSGTEQNWRNGQMHLIDKSGTKILPDSGNSAAKPDFLSFRSVNSSFKCGMNTIGDEVKGSSAAHGDRCA